MGDSCSSHHDEQSRYDTFNGHEFSVDSKLLAKAGFYYTAKGDVKCFNCKLKVSVKAINESDIMMIHKEKSPDCVFSKKFIRPRINKKFTSYDSLRFEKVRLETFIDWPIKWLHPAELAADGFYYLRTADHCACIFCRGIIGVWESGDTPRKEHHRHFPHCPFIRGQPVGNVPITHGNTLPSWSSWSSRENIPHQINQIIDIDICGTSRQPGSHSECRRDISTVEASLNGIGLTQYHGPEHKDYVTSESRIKSFDGWPESVTQIPQDLVEAGFFYCGLSDHVRCFHCGNGIRNWERGDIPWNEHARLYPKCHYVRLMKGQGFIDEIQREEESLQTTTNLLSLPAQNEVNCLPSTDILCSGEISSQEPDPKDTERRSETQQASQRDTEKVKVSGAEVKGACEMSCSSSTSSLNHSNEVTVEGEDTEEKNQAMTSEGERRDACVSPIQSSGKTFDIHMTCKVCMDAEMNVVFLPCVHMVTCNSCAVALTKCPVCRRDIKHVIKPIIS